MIFYKLKSFKNKKVKLSEFLRLIIELDTVMRLCRGLL